MIRRLTAIGVCFPIVLSGQTFDAARFGNPPATVRPALLWYWSAGITDSLIDVQLSDMRRVGVVDVIVELSSSDTAGAWRAHFAHAQQEAQRAGMRVRLNDVAHPVRVVGGRGSPDAPEQLRAQIGRLAARGETGPGRIAFVSDPANPLSAALGDLVTWTARVTDLGLGRSAARMAVLLRTRDSAFTRVVERLDQVQAIFDVVPEAALAGGAQGSGEIRVGAQSYRVVIVPPTDSLSGAVAGRLAALARSGGSVVAWRPLPATAGATVWPDTGPRFRLLDSLGQLRATMIRTPWSGVREPGPTALRLRAVERGEDRVFVLVNTSDRRMGIAPTFRIIGQPELWNPDDGTMRLAPSRWSPRFAVTDVPIELEPLQVVGIVFRARPRSPRGPVGPPPVERTVAQARPEWRFHFGDSDTTWRPMSLGSWTALDSTYTGSGVYETTIDIPPLNSPSGGPERYLLDLGQVRDVAEVEWDGMLLGRRLWRPYRFDVTRLLKPGMSRIRVRVTNTIANRNGSPLPSGLLGPVRIVGVREAR